MCQPAKSLQRSNLTNDSTCYRPNKAEDDEADGTFADLGQALAVLDYDDAYVEQ